MHRPGTTGQMNKKHQKELKNLGKFKVVGLYFGLNTVRKWE